MSDLIVQLKKAPYQFGLFQAASLIERIAANQGEVSSTGTRNHPVQFKSHLSFGFPSADIQAIKQEESGAYQVYSSLMCLAGSGGPLPLVFTEMLLASRRNKDHAPADFLDIFNNRLLHLLYSAKQKYEPALGFRPLNEMPTLRFVDASASLGRMSEDQSSKESLWLKHASLTGASPRSIVTLLAMLKERVGISFEAHQFLGTWLNLPVTDQSVLGRSKYRKGQTQLGVNSTLGARAWHQGGAILLKAKNIMPSDFFSLLPGNGLHQKIKWMIERHQSSHYRVCLEINVHHRHYKLDGLGGGKGPRLGLNSWLAGSAGRDSMGGDSSHCMEPSRFWLSAEPGTQNGISV